MYIAPLNKEKLNSNGRPGFLLIEIMIAFFIMTSMTLVIAHYQGRIAQWQRDISLRLHAIDTLRSYLDSITSSQTLPQIHSLELDNFTIRYNIKSYSEPIKNLTTKFSKKFHIIDATISWKSTLNKETSIAVRTGIYVT